MYKLFRMKGFVFISVPISLVLALFCTSIVVGQVDNPTQLEQKLSGISEEEKKVLQNLFKLTQEIQIAEEEERTISKEIESLNLEIEDFGARIKSEEISYTTKQEGLKQVMKTYQRMGPGSFLEIIMNSDSLSSFLRRINTMRDFTRNTGKLLEKLEESKEKLELEKKGLNEKLVLVEKKQQESKESLNKKLLLKKEQEDYLASLKEQRDFYYNQLQNLQKMMEELKSFLSNTSEKFSGIIESGSLPPEALKISFSFSGIKGSIDDKILNEAIQNQPELPKIIFAIHEEKTEISFPEKNLVISGNFIVQNGHILKFQTESGNFYGMPLEEVYIKDLFKDGGIIMDLQPLLEGNTLESIESKEGYLELSIKYNFFR